MKHKSWWCYFAWQYGCPVCKVKQLKGRKGSDGFEQEVSDIMFGSLFTWEESQWILEQVGAMATIDENVPAVAACEWCRMGIHKKCDRIHKLHAICVCDCERGF